MFRTLVESDLFRRQLESFAQALANEAVLDEVLDAVAWALSRKPEARPVIQGTSALRVISTREYKRAGIIIPALKVWYRILDENSVLLMAITRQDIEESDELDF